MFCPDLLARMSEEWLYVECERQTNKKSSERARKWDIYYRASKGQFYIVTPTESAMQAIASEIETWAMSDGKKLRLWATNLKQRMGKIGTSVWLMKREIG